MHLRANPAARRSRYGCLHRALRTFFAVNTFARFVALYLLIDVGFVLAELVFGLVAPNWIPAWTASGPPPAPDIKAILLNVSSYLITAQVGVLGVISLALALVTLIAQRENSATDVKVYYHASLSFEIVASSIALLAVLCVQLLWPLQFLLHKVGFSTNLQAFKLGLLVIHFVWLLMNLAGLAHFIATTFAFVQQSAREALRERYLASEILPRDMSMRLRQQLYLLAAHELPRPKDGSKDCPSVTFGSDFGLPHVVELETSFPRPMGLYGVRIRWVAWVLRRWSARCIRKAIRRPKSGARPLGRQEPMLWFTPVLDRPMIGAVSWCRRQGGEPLTGLERWVLRRAFRFRRVVDEI
jgi:hypothetical protein